jgi:anti-sigma factor RsiW
MDIVRETKLDCREYISEYLSAHADNELTARERSSADEHVAKCASCRARLVEERSLKALIRSEAGIVRTPSDVRMRIRAALGDIAETTHRGQPALAASARRGVAIAREGFAHRRTSAADTPVARLSRNRLLAAVGTAVVLVVALGIFAVRGVPRGAVGSIQTVPAFDMAIGKYLALERNFTPNVPPEAYSNTDGAVYAWVQNRDPVERVATSASDTFDDVARAYREMSMPDDLLDLSPAGYRLTGGRAESLPDGRPITYTLYTSDNGAILSIAYPDAAMASPVGAVNWVGMRSFYEYKGYSICMSFYSTGHFVSILVSHMPVSQLLRDVAAADAIVASK